MVMWYAIIGVWGLILISMAVMWASPKTFGLGSDNVKASVSLTTDAAGRLVFYHTNDGGVYSANNFGFLPVFQDADEYIVHTTHEMTASCSENFATHVMTNKNRIYSISYVGGSSPAAKTTWDKVQNFPSGVTKFIGSGGAWIYDALLGDNGIVYYLDNMTILASTTKVSDFGINISDVTNFFVISDETYECVRDGATAIIVYKDSAQPDRYKFKAFHLRTDGVTKNVAVTVPDFITDKRIDDIAGWSDYSRGTGLQATFSLSHMHVYAKLEGDPSFKQTLNGGNWENAYNPTAYFPNSEYIKGSLTWTTNTTVSPYTSFISGLSQSTSGEIKYWYKQAQAGGATGLFDTFMSFKTCKAYRGESGIFSWSPGVQYYAFFAVNQSCNDPVNYCGDGRITGSEKCDDGNITSGDGCSSTCQIETSPNGGGAVTASPSVHVSVVGPDGVSANATVKDQIATFTLTVTNPTGSPATVKFDLPPGFTYDSMDTTGSNNCSKTTPDITAPSLMWTGVTNDSCVLKVKAKAP